MAVSIDPMSDRAVFKQIADHLRREISQGDYPPGGKLPSENELVKRFGVTRLTVRRALAVLAGEGLTYSEHGRGVFVRRRPPVKRLASDRFARRHREQGKAAFTVEMEAAGMPFEVEVLEVGRAPAPEEAASRLGVDVGAEVVLRRRRYLGEGMPLEVATSYLPVDVAGGTPIEESNPGPGGIYARIEEQGLELSRFVEDLKVRPASDGEARALSLPKNAPVLRLIRTAYAGERAVEVCDTIMNAVAFELSYELPAR